MPQQINEPVEFKGSGRHATIDWEEIADGQTYRLVFGDDFDSDPTSVQNSARQAAIRRGLRARTKREGDDVIVQFFNPDNDK